MSEATKQKEIDVEKKYTKTEVIDKLRRFADALEQDKTFQIQIDNNRINVPPYATVEFEYEKEGDVEEIEIEFKWSKQVERD